MRLLSQGEHDGFFPKQGGDNIRDWGRSQVRMRQSRKSTIDGPWEAEQSMDSPPNSIMESISWEK